MIFMKSGNANQKGGERNESEPNFQCDPGLYDFIGGSVYQCWCIGYRRHRNTRDWTVQYGYSSKYKGEGKFQFSVGSGRSCNDKSIVYSFSASVDFGLLTPNGAFLYVNVTDGSVDQEIEVDQRGNYTLAVRNNSSKEISVSGFVNY